MTDRDRLRTHARTIVEGEGAEEFDPALVEAVARAICSKAFGGFCQYVGGDLGCKNGRGGSGPHLCVASREQLLFAWEGGAAQAALSTIRKHQAGE